MTLLTLLALMALLSPMTDLSLESLIVDEDSTPGAAPDGEDGPCGESAAGTDSAEVAIPGRHRPRRRDQWSMTGTTPRRGLLARLREVLLGRTSLRPVGARA
jgi:hypothetical protein